MRERSLAAAALLCAWQPAHAQRGTDTARQSLTIFVGQGEENRRDDTDSPLAYSGSGPAARLDYAWARAGRRAYLSVSGGASELTPSASIQDLHSKESFSAYALEAGLRWRLAGVAGRAAPERAGELSLGVEFGASATIARHHYNGAQPSVQNFVLGLATLGPTARWTRRLGTGAVAAAFTLPVIALVDHPYADVRFASQLTKLRVAPPSQFHQAAGELSYALRPDRPVGITLTYRFGIMALNDLEPVYRGTQSLAIGVVRRFGATP